MTRKKTTVADGGGAGVAGILVVRLLVPLWLMTGALLSLASGSASHLPESLIKWLGPLGVNLVFVLYFGAAVELSVVALAWFLPRLGRIAQILLLAFFLPILVGDIVFGSGACGCFGAVAVPPWFTLIVDVLLLVGVIWVGGRPESQRWSVELPSWRVAAAGLLTVAAFAFSFGLMMHRPGSPEGREDGPAERELELAAQLPEYYLPEYSQWLGQQWSEVPVARFMSGDLGGIENGLHYILFYRKDCEHCHELMAVFFNDMLPGPTTAVAVPEKDGFPSENVQPFECDSCTLAELPAGCDWFMQTPVLVRLQDGVVECAAEVSAADPQCLLF